jgi:DNA-directed RNA polymerase specialized sigma24 family protein
MRVQHQLPYEEIARVMNLSLAAVKVKVHRVRLKLAAMQLNEETEPWK